MSVVWCGDPSSGIAPNEWHGLHYTKHQCRCSCLPKWCPFQLLSRILCSKRWCPKGPSTPPSFWRGCVTSICFLFQRCQQRIHIQALVLRLILTSYHRRLQKIGNLIKKVPRSIGPHLIHIWSIFGPLTKETTGSSQHTRHPNTSKEVRASLRKDWILRELSCGG